MTEKKNKRKATSLEGVATLCILEIQKVCFENNLSEEDTVTVLASIGLTLTYLSTKS